MITFAYRSELLLGLGYAGLGIWKLAYLKISHGRRHHAFHLYFDMERHFSQSVESWFLLGR